MNNSIDRRAAIDALEEYLEEYDGLDEYGLHSEKWCAMSEAKMAIEALPPEQRWILCSERLPNEGERVLATHIGGLNPSRQVIEHIYQNGKFTCGWDMDNDVYSPTFGKRFMGEVIAWMPLPEPYGGEEE